MPEQVFEIIGTALFTAILVMASLNDIRKRKVYPSTYFCLIAVSFIPKNIDLTASIIGAVSVFVPMFLSALICDDLGGGDVKFASACAFFIGSWGLSLGAVGIGCIACLICVPIMKKLGKFKKKTIPLVPFLSFGFLVVAIFKLWGNLI